MAELWTQISDAIPANFEHVDIELSWIFALRLYQGVRVNIGLYDPEWTPSGTINLDYLKYIFRRLASNGLKCQLGLGGSGPDIDSWKTLNSGTAWYDVTRPPFGTSDAVLNRVVDIKNACIEAMDEVYGSYGLDPYDYCFIELGTEPAIGGAGAPPSTNTSWYTLMGATYAASLGLWDSFTGTAYGESYLGFLTLETFALDFLGMRVIAPSFAALYTGNTTSGTYRGDSLTTELSTFDDLSMGESWLAFVRSKAELSFALRAKYEAFNDGPATIAPELIAWPSLSPERYRRMAIYGFDGRGYVASDATAYQTDHDSMAHKVSVLRNHAVINSNPIVLSGAGVHESFAGMADSTTRMIWGGTANYFLNYERLEQITLSYLDGLREDLGAERVIHQGLTDLGPLPGHPTDVWPYIFGIFYPDASMAGFPTLQSSKTYSRALAWAKRSGLPRTGDVTITAADKGTYWNKQFIKGASEENS